MALSLKLNRVAVNALGTEMYLADGTGDYSTPDNEGGYGTPNAARNTKALLLSATLNKTTGDVSVEIDPYDPEVSEEFTLQCTNDGYYEILMAAVDKTVPVVEDAYGWTDDGGLVQLIDGSLVTKTVQDLYDDPSFIDVISFKTVLLARMAIERNTSNSDLSTLMIAHQDDRGHKRIISDKQEEYNRLRAMLEAARYQWCLDAYTAAQTIVETFEKAIANE